MIAAAFTFARSSDTAYGHALSCTAPLPGGASLIAAADLHSDRIELRMIGDAMSCRMAFTAAQARSLATELAACADARDVARDAAAQGRA